LEDDEDAGTATLEDDSPQFEWWEEAEWQAEVEEEDEMLEEQAVLLESFAMIREEERAHVAKACNVTAANDAEASVSGVAATSSTGNKEIIYISSDIEEKEELY
jgi:hypothetical protein